MLWRKMLRDILENRLAYFACALVVAIGLMIYTSMSMVQDDLFMAKDQFYRDYHFADGFAKVKAIPNSRVKTLNEIEGIGKVNGRLVKDVKVIMSGSHQTVYLRLISLQEVKGDALNGVELIKGSFPEKNRRQILLADKFYTANNLQVGNKIQVVIESKQVELTISGSGQSPEFVYAMKEAQSLTPDPKTFEVAYLPYEDMVELFAQEGLVNDLSFTLRPGVKYEDVEQKLKSELKPYELESLYSAKDQLSNRILTEKLTQLQKTANSVPILFLGISSMILFIMLKRLVESQRGQIGTMKAFGYRKWEIVRHYLNYGLLIGVFGGCVGGLLGTALSFPLIQVYRTYFSLPNLTAHFSWQYFLKGILMSALFSLTASFQGVRGALKLQPAEAMHPPVPDFVSKSWLEKVPVFWRMFNVQGRMAIRNMLRNKGRSFFTFTGILFTFGMMACFFSLGKMADIMVLDQFTKVQRQDVKLTFSKPLPLNETVRELQHVKGVHRIEPILEVPVSLRHLYYQSDVVALGIIENSILYNIFDKSGTRLEVPKTGVMLSQQVAEKLHVQRGDVLQMDSVWFKEPKIKVQVEQIVPQYLGSNIYLSQNSLLHMLQQGDMVTSILITIDQTEIPHLKDLYSTSKDVSQIEVRQELIDKYQQLIGSSAYTLWIMAVMAVVTGFAIVYNSSIISLAERKRELASLRVMGMTTREVMEVISVEQWLIGLTGMIAGIPLAIAMNQTLAKSMSSDLFTLPNVISPIDLLQAFIGTVFAIWVAQKGVSRKIKRLNIVEVLKERE